MDHDYFEWSNKKSWENNFLIRYLSKRISRFQRYGIFLVIFSDIFRFWHFSDISIGYFWQWFSLAFYRSFFDSDISLTFYRPFWLTFFSDNLLAILWFCFSLTFLTAIFILIFSVILSAIFIFKIWSQIFFSKKLESDDSSMSADEVRRSPLFCALY